ncbi:unnamed protein product [Cylindrotheca closterium]|uniref:Uncharacterized protein n=1 Tax=Cylindrotheca closterium TaxID=2856 RepID=A0AAD2GC49_9STRA|nr:unnamed protein product [Cylindrotheca closterium]
MKIKSLLSKFQRKKKSDNVLKQQGNSKEKNLKQRNKKRGTTNVVGSPSSSLRTQRTDDDDSDGLYHPDYVPPPSLNFVQDDQDIGEAAVSQDCPETTSQALNESLYSDDIVGENIPAKSRDLTNKRSVTHGVPSEMVWTNAALLDDLSEDENNTNIHSSEYHHPDGEVDEDDDDSKYLSYAGEHLYLTPMPPSSSRPTMTLTSLALDSTRASNMYRTYETDFDDFGLTTGVVVVDDELGGNYQKSKDNNDVLGDLSHENADHRSNTPKKTGGITPVRWSSQVTDMSLPPPPPPEPDFPMDEMYDDLRVLILDDDVSALSNDTPPPAVYRNMKRELRKKNKIPVTSSSFSKCKPHTTWANCQPPSFLRRIGTQSPAAEHDGKLRVADMFYQVFHCENTVGSAGVSSRNNNKVSSTSIPPGTTITVTTTRSGSIEQPTHLHYYEQIFECAEA